MGCDVCRQKELEANFYPELKYEYEENMNTTEKKQNYQKFVTIFDNNIEKFGQYFGQDFNILIPKKIQDYMAEHPLKIDQDLLQDLEVYEMKPVEFKNGNIYEGGWNHEFKLEGEGKYYLKKDGVYAEGVWKGGNLIFARVFTGGEDELEIYEGQIQNSTYNGKGKLIESNGTIYEGDFVDGEKTGYGRIIFNDETVYEGTVENGELKGNGKMIWKNGYEYEGSFDANKLNGNGELKNSEGDIYNGEFQNNLFNGGNYTYANGNSYEGEFLYGVKKGKGIYKCLNNYIYEGEWDNDLPCGKGRLKTWDDNGIIKCTWRYGQIVEEPEYEKGSSDDFNDINLNIIPDDMMLKVNELSNLEISEYQTSQYQLNSIPSFLED